MSADDIGNLKIFGNLNLTEIPRLRNSRKRAYQIVKKFLTKNITRVQFITLIRCCLHIYSHGIENLWYLFMNSFLSLSFERINLLRLGSCEIFLICWSKLGPFLEILQQINIPYVKSMFSLLVEI